MPETRRASVIPILVTMRNCRRPRIDAASRGRPEGWDSTYIQVLRRKDAGGGCIPGTSRGRVSSATTPNRKRSGAFLTPSQHGLEPKGNRRDR